MKKTIQKIGVGCVLCFGALAVNLVANGCDSGPQPQAVVEADRLKVATELRGYFNKANGDYSALSPEDKTAFAKLAGGDGKAEKVFNAMKTAPHRAGGG